MAILARDLLRNFPHPVRERSKLLGAETVNRGGDFVLYWMHCALRDHDNPALDAALIIAEDLKCPLVVYSSIDATPAVTLRQAYFQLQSYQDVHQRLMARNVTCYLTFSQSGKPLLDIGRLSSQARVIVSEDTPIPEWRERILSLVSLRQHTPVLLVNTACVIPSSLIDDVSFTLESFRSRTMRQRKEHFGQPWPVSTPFPKARYETAVLPFTPVQTDSSKAFRDMAVLPFDNTIPITPSLQGGYDAAYAHWQRFVSKSMRFYPKQERTPLHSALAVFLPYLRYGQVSPFRLLREALADNGDGAWQTINYLFIERELAYHFIEHIGAHLSLRSLPVWALRSLESRRKDARQELSAKSLLGEKSPSAAWDCLFGSLRDDGILHEQGRTFWAQSLYSWTDRPDDYLPKLHKLYNRYALDGDDPVSLCFGLQALGLFQEEPVEKTTAAIFGVIPSVLDPVAKTLTDIVKKSERLKTRSRHKEVRVAVVGAGIAGLTCASVLEKHRILVTVFDKARAVGGRVTTKSIERYQFDIGAPFFKPNDALFKEWIALLADEDVIREWDASIYSTSQKAGLFFDKKPFVGVPSMSALAHHYAKRCHTVKLSTHIASIAPADGGWRLLDKDGGDCGFFDAVVLAMPAPQAVELLSPIAPSPAAYIHQRVEMLPVWVALAAFSEPLSVTFDMAAFTSPVLRYAIRNATKPDRQKNQECWVFHATTEWTEDHIDAKEALVVKTLTEELSKLFGLKVPKLVYASAHRWKYAFAANPLGESHLYANRLGVCGDWCLGRRVEDAFTSGQAMAGRVALELANLSISE